MNDRLPRSAALATRADGDLYFPAQVKILFPSGDGRWVSVPADQVGIVSDAQGLLGFLLTKEQRPGGAGR